MAIILGLFTFCFWVANVEAVASTGPLLQETQEDLNNDGKLDKISISMVKGTSKFTLTVNQTKVTGFLGNSPDDADFEPDGFYIVDIDNSDNYKEIAVHSSGPSDDHVYLIYYYDGKSLQKMGKLYGVPAFSGNGIVLVENWGGFWLKKDKYVVEKDTRKLKKVPQEFYYVGVVGKVKESFPIYFSRQSNAVVANLQPGSEATILLSDGKEGPKEWYLIKSVTGLIGWARMDALKHLDGLPWAD